MEHTTAAYAATGACANTAQYPGPESYFDGWFTNAYPGPQGQLIEGINSLHTDRGGYELCTSSAGVAGSANMDNSLSSWALLSSGDFGGYAQAGDVYYYGASCVLIFAQSKQNAYQQSYTQYLLSNNSAGGYSAPNKACSAAGDQAFMWVQMIQQTNNTGPYLLRQNWNQTVLDQTTWQPTTAGNWTTPYYGQLASEAHFIESDVPGSAAAPEGQGDVTVQQVPGAEPGAGGTGGFVTTCGNGPGGGQGFGADNDNGAYDSNWNLNGPACNANNEWTVNP